MIGFTVNEESFQLHGILNDKPMYMNPNNPPTTSSKLQKTISNSALLLSSNNNILSKVAPVCNAALYDARDHNGVKCNSEDQTGEYQQASIKILPQGACKPFLALPTSNFVQSQAFLLIPILFSLQIFA